MTSHHEDDPPSRRSPAASDRPVFVVDRATCLTRFVLVETITSYLEMGSNVQVEDSSRTASRRLCYEIRPGEAAFHLSDASGHQTGVFASVDALIGHAEAMTP